MVGGGANETAADDPRDVLAEPEIAAQMRAAVLVGGRRWDLHLDNGVTVKLPEKHVREALAQLVKLERASSSCSRATWSSIDLRLPDRVTVRLPEGRTLEDVTSEARRREGARHERRGDRNSSGVSRVKPLGARRSTTVSVLDVGSTQDLLPDRAREAARWRGS